MLARFFGATYGIILIITGLLTLLSAITNTVSWVWVIALLSGIFQIILGVLSFIGFTRVIISIFISKVYTIILISNLILNSMLLGIAIVTEGSTIFPLLATIISLALFMGSRGEHKEKKQLPL